MLEFSVAIQSPDEAAFDAEVPGDRRPYEVVISVMRAPRQFFTVTVVTPAENADREVSFGKIDFADFDPEKWKGAR